MIQNRFECPLPNDKAGKGYKFTKKDLLALLDRVYDEGYEAGYHNSKEYVAANVTTYTTDDTDKIEYITPAKAREIADNVNRMKFSAISSLKLTTWEQYKKDAIEAITYAASKGNYEADSPNLYGYPSIYEGVEWTPEALADYLFEKTKEYFGKQLGFTISKQTSNYLTISWKVSRKEKEDE